MTMSKQSKRNSSQRRVTFTSANKRSLVAGYLSRSYTKIGGFIAFYIRYTCCYNSTLMICGMAIALGWAPTIVDLLYSQLMTRERSCLRIACLGWPDILFTEDELLQILPNRPSSTFVKSNVIRHTGYERRGRETMSAERFFRLLNGRLYAIDAAKHNNKEIICDLNLPGSTDPYSSRFDVVIDNGTLEHCFNIGEAFVNAASLVAMGGIILHSNPFLMPNHGFYCLNPTAYSDFYTSNGFEILHIGLLHSPTASPIASISKNDYTRRFSLGTEACDMVLNAIARRVIPKERFVYPIQTKYKKRFSR